MKYKGWASSILKGNLILIAGQRFAKGREVVLGLPWSPAQPCKCQYGSEIPLFICPCTRWAQAVPHRHQQSTDRAYLLAWDTKKAIDSKGAGEKWWSKGFSLSSYTVEPILPVHHMERERGEKSPPNISTQSLVACTHESANSHRQTQVWVRLRLISVQVIILCTGFLSAIIASDIPSKRVVTIVTPESHGTAHLIPINLENIFLKKQTPGKLQMEVSFWD